MTYEDMDLTKAFKVIDERLVILAKEIIETKEWQKGVGEAVEQLRDVVERMLGD